MPQSTWQLSAQAGAGAGNVYMDGQVPPEFWAQPL